MSEYRNEFQYEERFQVHDAQLRLPWEYVIVSGIFSRSPTSTAWTDFLRNPSGS
jgi:hypothetical protein